MWEEYYPDELRHWKYIKRVKVNGKWRYYYEPPTIDLKDMLGYDEREDYEKAKTERSAAMKNLATESRRNSAVRKEVGNKIVATKSDVKKLLKSEDDLKSATSRSVSAGKKYVSSKEKFKRTPLGFVTVTMPETINRGKSWLQSKLKMA